MPTSVQVVRDRPRGKELALAARRRQSEEQSDSEQSRNSGSESEPETFVNLPKPTSNSSRGRATSRPRKKKRKQRSRSASEESDHSRRPLSNSIHHNRQLQRASELEKMGGSTKAERAAARALKKQQEAAKKAEEAKKPEEELSVEKENEALKLQVIRLQKRQKLTKSGSSAASGTQSAMVREVGKCAKTKLWKICKFIKNDAKLQKATKFVMEQLSLLELEGLKGEALVEAQEAWKATYSSEVRQALNRQRNYVQQELRELMENEVFKKDRVAEFPNKEDMLQLALRNKLDDKTPDAERQLYETKFDNMWNLLMPKVAGHHSWGPNKRHYGLMSTMKENGADQDATPHVSASDEAFLVVIWENCYQKWVYKEKCRREGTEPDPEHADMKTPFTDSKGGQKKYGGWNKEGMARYTEVLTQIHLNRKDEKDYIKAVEEEALKRIQKVENIEEKEANRKSKKRSKPAAEEEDEETDDENDYSAW